MSIKMERARYMVIYSYYERKFSVDELRKILNSNIGRIYGIEGSLDLGLYISWTHDIHPVYVIRLAHLYTNKFYNCLMFIREFNTKKVNFIPIKTFGSIKQAKEFIADYNWDELRTNLQV